MTMNHNPNKIMKTKSRVKKDVLAHLKVWLMHGKTITHNNAQQMWGTNRLAEFIRRLRNAPHFMNIECEMKSYADGNYGEYKLVIKKKVSKIKSREYLNVGVG
jgi:hypothetical protein